MKPRVSVVVPVFNVERYLDRCIQSLKNQTLQEMEIILVDDGSPDNCPAMCDRYAELSTNIRVVHKQNEGLGMACNTGLEVAVGRYVAFLDSDDWVDPDMYRTMLHTAEEYHAQMVFVGFRRVNEHNTVSFTSQASEFRFYRTAQEVNTFLLGMIASEPSLKKERQVQMSAKVVLYDREFIESNHVRFVSERKLISEDLFFNLDNLVHADRVVQLPEIYYNYFINNASLTQTIRLDRFDKTLIMRNELLSRYKGVTAEFRTRVDRMFIGYAREALRQIAVASNVGLCEKLRLIRKICSHPQWQDIGRSYPISLMPFLHKVFLKCILDNYYLLVYIFARFKR